MIYCNFIHSYLVLIIMKIFRLIFLCCVLFLVNVSGVYATDHFIDDFTIKDENKWNYLENGGTILFENGKMQLSSSSFNFPYITNSAVEIFNEKDEIFIEFNFDYPSTGFMGNGIGIGYTGSDGYPYYQISVWNDLTSGIVLQYQNDIVSNGGICDYSQGLKKINIDKYLNKDSIENILRIEKHGTAYTVYINSFEVLKTPQDQCIPKNIFIGNSLSGGGTNWTKLNIDKIRVSDILPSKTKIILLPGLGASWNTEAITVGSTHVDSKWTMTPFVKNYDKLISAFESNSLVRGQDYYVWNYDWRKPLSQIVADFDTFVTSLNLSENEKLNLVGHSLGGLVARLWTQDHGEKVNKTVTLGSPHYGSVKAYLAWNGLKFGDNSMANIALNVFLGLKNGEVRVKNVREFAPIVFDLNPTFSFLKKNGRSVTSASSQYLQEMNNRVNLINPLLVTVDGVGVKTLSGISLGERTMFDKVFGVWEEGRPIAYEKSIGDGTVLKTSALVEGSKNIEKVSNHSDLVDKTINEVMDELGLNRPITLLKRGVVLAANPEMSIFFTDLDGDMKIVCNDEEKNDIEGWVWFEGVDRENCKASFTGGANSEYRLVAGGGDQWQSFKGVLNSEGRAEIDLNPKDFSWMLLRQKASELGATQMIAAIDKKNILTTINAYINFRTKNKKSQHSEEILESLRIILESENKTRAEIERQYRAAKNAKVVAESNLRLMVRKKIKPSFYSSLTYNQAEGLMVEGKNYAANYLAEKLYKIIWR